MEVKEIKNKQIWESFLLDCEEKTFLDSWNWGEFNKMIGNKTWRWGIYNNEQLEGIALIVKIGARRGTFLFVPHGPLLRNGNPNSEIRTPKQFQILKFKILNIFLQELKKLAKKEKASFIRIAPIWERTEENEKIFKKLGFRQAPIHIHPDLTWQIDITSSEEELLMRMRKTTRYLIRQALKNKDIIVAQNQDIKDIEIFNQLYQATVKRHDFAPFSLDYLKKEFFAFEPDNQIAIFLGKHKNKILASAMIIYWQDIAFYHQGASINSNFPVSYLVQWEAIKEAKKRGCKIYNFWGITDGDRKHPWWGLTLFKTGFGGYEKAYVKTQDFVLSSKYWFNFLVESIRRKKRGL